MSSNENQTNRHSIKVSPDVFQALNLMKDVHNFSSINEVVDFALKQTFPNIDKLLQVSEEKERERLAAVRKAMGEEAD